MSLSHLLRVLVTLSVLAVPGVAFAQCTKDTDCKGDRVCENGACVSPSERAPERAYTPPPAPPPSEPPPAARPPPRAAPARPPVTGANWDATARKNVIATNVLYTIGGWVTAAQNQAAVPGLSIQQFGFLYERALTPNISVFGTLVPNYWTSQFNPPALYIGVTVGGRYYFFGEAPGGFWAGGEIGNLPLDAGPGAIAEVGYQWLFDSGLQLGLIGGLVLATNQAGGISPGLGLGALIGWNF